MPQYPDIFYTPSYVDKVHSVDTAQVADTLQIADTVALDSVVPSFITSGFKGSLVPLPRMSYEVLQGWNLALLGIMLLLIVLNKQLYPRQFRQVLSVPGGVSHTNQLLREWNPKRSFICVSLLLCYILLLALFIQKSFVVFSHDVSTYNVVRIFGILCALMTGWVLLRYAVLHLVNWLFDARETVDRQMAVKFSVSIYTLIVMMPLVLLLLYNPSRYFVWIGVALLGLSALTRLVVGMIETRVATKIPAFYIFLYLCALEIAPVAILVTAGWRYFSQGTVF
jgi:hypothetical protein